MLPFELETAPASALALDWEGSLLSADVWVDERGPFLVVTAERSSHLLHYDGTGWTTWTESRAEEPSFSHLTGTAGGVVFTWPWTSGCKLRESLSPGTDVCVATDVIESLPISEAFFNDSLRGWIARGNVGVSGSDYVQAVGVEGNRVTASFSCHDIGRDVLAVWGDPVGGFLLTPNAVCAGGGSHSGVRGDIPRGPYADMWVESRDRMIVAATDGRLLEYVRRAWNMRSTGLAELTHMAGTPEGLAFAGPRAIGQMPREGEPQRLAEWSDAGWRVAALAAHDENVYAVLFGEGCNPAVIRFTGGRATRL